MVAMMVLVVLVVVAGSVIINPNRLTHPSEDVIEFAGKELAHTLRLLDKARLLLSAYVNYSSHPLCPGLN